MCHLLGLVTTVICFQHLYNVHLTAFLSFGQGKEKRDTYNTSTTENMHMARVRQKKYTEKGQVWAKTKVRVMSCIIEKLGFWI